MFLDLCNLLLELTVHCVISNSGGVLRYNGIPPLPYLIYPSYTLIHLL